MPPPNPELRRQVITIYKGAIDPVPQTLFPALLRSSRQGRTASTNDLLLTLSSELLNLGKDYPLGFSYFRPRLHKAFMANAGMRDEEQIRRGIARAEFVRKGTYARRWALHVQWSNGPQNSTYEQVGR